MRIGVIVGKSNPACVKFVMDAIFKQFPNTKIITEQGKYSKLLLWAVDKVSFGNVEDTAFLLFIDAIRKQTEYIHPLKYFAQKGVVPFIDYFQEEIKIEEMALPREQLVLTPPPLKKSDSINYRQGQLFAPKFGQ